MNIGTLTASIGLDASELGKGAKEAGRVLANLSKQMTSLQKIKKLGAGGDTSAIDTKIKGVIAQMDKLGYKYQEFSNTATVSIDKTDTAIVEQGGLIENIVNQIKEWEIAMVKATSPEGIAFFNKKIAEARFELRELGAMGGKTQKQITTFADISTMSLGEMRQELRRLRMTPITGLTAEDSIKYKKRMAELTAAVRDYGKQVRMAGGSATKVMINGMMGVMGAATGVVGVMGLLGGENEKLQQTMQGMMSVTMALSSVYQLYEAETFQAIGAKIKETVATIAQTVATKVQTVTTVGATAATKALRIAMLALPFVAIITAIAATVTALFLLKKRTDETKDKIAEMKKEQEGNNRIMKDAYSAMAQPLASLLLMEKRLKGAVSNQKEYGKVVQEWNDNYGKKFNSSLSTTKGSLEDITAALKKTREAVINLSMAEAIGKEISSIYEENLNAILFYQKQKEEAERQAKNTNKYQIKQYKEEGAAITVTAGLDQMRYREGEKALNKINKLLDTQVEYVSKVDMITENTTKETKKELKEVLFGWEKINKEIGVLETKQKELAILGYTLNTQDTEKLDTLRKQVAYAQELVNIQNELSKPVQKRETYTTEFKQSIQPTSYYSATKEQLSALQTELESLLKPANEMSEKDIIKVNNLKESMVYLQGMITEMDKLGDTTTDVMIRIERGKQAIEDLHKVMAGGMVDAINAVGSALGGMNNGFEGVVTSMLSGIGSIINALLQEAIVAIATGAAKTIPFPPAALAAAAVGIAALKAMISKEAKPQGLATGGFVTSGGEFMVGERGPERVTLPRGSAVTPNHMLDGGGVLTTKISGRDLEIILNRAQAQSKRR